MLSRCVHCRHLDAYIRALPPKLRVLCYNGSGASLQAYQSQVEAMGVIEWGAGFHRD